MKTAPLDKHVNAYKALATVVGVLVEVPVMLSVCKVRLATRGWFDGATPART